MKKLISVVAVLMLTGFIVGCSPKDPSDNFSSTKEFYRNGKLVSPDSVDSIGISIKEGGNHLKMGDTIKFSAIGGKTISGGQYKGNVSWIVSPKWAIDNGAYFEPKVSKIGELVTFHAPSKAGDNVHIRAFIDDDVYCDFPFPLTIS